MHSLYQPLVLNIACMLDLVLDINQMFLVKNKVFASSWDLVVGKELLRTVEYILDLRVCTCIVLIMHFVLVLFL